MTEPTYRTGVTTHDHTVHIHLPAGITPGTPEDWADTSPGYAESAFPQPPHLVRVFGGPRPEIVVLCGSTRFVDEFNRQRKDLTQGGAIVLSIEVVTTQARDEDPQHVNPELKARLDELHLRKIDLADRVLVLNVDGYIGESTSREIAYAESLNRPIEYLQPLGGGDR